MIQAKAHLKCTETKWKIVLWSDKSKFEILSRNHESSRLKRKGTSIQFKSLHFWWYGGVFVAMETGNLDIWKAQSVLNVICLRPMHTYIQCIQRLLQGRPCIFQQDNAELRIVSITTAWLYRRRLQVLNCSTCNPELSPIGNIFCGKNGKDNPGLWSSLNDKNGTKFLSQRFSNWSPQFPDCLQTVAKRRGDPSQW